MVTGRIRRVKNHRIRPDPDPHPCRDSIIAYSPFYKEIIANNHLLYGSIKYASIQNLKLEHIIIGKNRTFNFIVIKTMMHS